MQVFFSNFLHSFSEISGKSTEISQQKQMFESVDIRKYYVNLLVDTR